MHELAVYVHLELDQARQSALVDHDVVEGETLTDGLPIAHHRGGKQHALLGIEFPGQYAGHAVEHGLGDEIGQETEAAAIDAYQWNIVIDQCTRHGQHGTVAADDDGKIGMRAKHINVYRGITLDFRLLRRSFLDQNVDAPFGEILRQRQYLLPYFRIHVLANDGNGLEWACHGWH